MITIVILLILAAISISALVGENGLITKTIKASEKTKIAKVEELAQLACMEAFVEGNGNISDETVITAVFNTLENAGYEVVPATSSGSKLKDIVVQEVVQDTTGNKTSSITLQQGQTTIIKVSLNIENNSVKYFVYLNEKYYEMRINNGKVTIDQNGRKGLEGLETVNYTIKLEPPTEGLKIRLKGTSENITNKITIVDGCELEVISGEETGKYSFSILEEVTNDVKNVEVTVIDNPLYATRIEISTTGNITTVKKGQEITLTAQKYPQESTDTIKWEITEGKELAEIDDFGVLTISNTAVVGEKIKISAKCIRGNGDISTIEDFYELLIIDAIFEDENYINSHFSFLTNKIYISSESGDDTNGDGSRTNPYKTIGKLTSRGIIEKDNSYLVILGEGEYNLETSFFQMSTCNEVIYFLGNKENTILKVGKLGGTSGPTGSSNYEVDFCRLIWDGTNNGNGNTIQVKNPLWFSNVVLKNIVEGNYGYLLATADNYLNNCTLIDCQNTKFFRNVNGKNYLRNSYGNFTSGLKTTQADWDDGTNYVTNDPKVNRITYRIEDDEDVWVGKRKNVYTRRTTQFE